MMSAYDYIIQYRDLLMDISGGGTYALYKKGKCYYRTPADKTPALEVLEFYSDGILLPGHVRQAIYNLNILLNDPKLAMQFPFFIRMTDYALRIYSGTYWSGPVPVITSSSKLVIKLSSLLYGNIRLITQKLSELT